jgi:hypothetical protein
MTNKDCLERFHFTPSPAATTEHHPGELALSECHRGVSSVTNGGAVAFKEA